MKTVVKGTGPKNADIMLVGEAPGKDEVRKGEPFIGSAGSYLDAWLRNAGVRRDQCYIDNVMQVRPKGNNFKLFYEDSKKTIPKDSLKRGRERLRNTIREVDPNITVLLGNEPMKAILGHGRSTKWRGSVLPTNVGKVMCMVHPAFVMRMYLPYNILSIIDMQKVKEESKFPEYNEPFNWSNLRAIKDPREAIRELKKADEAERLAFDLETPMGCRAPHMFGFCYDKDHAYCISFLKGTSHRYGLQEEKDIWYEVDRLMRSGIKVIAQNATFDVPALEKYGITVNNLWFDTMVAHHTACSELPKSLDLIASVYTDIPYYAYLNSEGGDEPYYYNCLDCLATFRSVDPILEELRGHEVEDYYRKVKHPVIRVAIDMQERGFKWNLDLRDKKIRQIERKRKIYQQELDDIAGHPVNVNSPKQMKEFLYEEKGFKKRHHRSTRKVTTNENALYALSLKHDDPCFDIILTIRHLDKLLGTYLRAELEEGRARTSYNVAGAVTGRWSSSKTVEDTGLDVQNIPRKFMRDLFVADDDHIIIAADYSQIESKIVAGLSGDKEMLKIFREGKDIHTHAASHVLGIPLEEVGKDERYIGKTCGHAANYGTTKRGYARASSEFKGLGPDGLPEKRVAKKMPEKVAQARLVAYYTWAMGVKMWHATVRDTIFKTRQIKNPLGWKRTFFDRLNDRTIREGINWAPQSTVSGLIDIALTNLFLSLPEESHLLLQNHDEIVLECLDDPDTIKSHVDLIRRCMEMEVMDGIHATVDVEVGKNWSDMEEWE